MNRQKRVLLFVHDGSGLGHLRRIARIASALQGPCASLVVSGIRQALWIVPESCELVHLPGWNSFSLTKSKYWNREVWLDIERTEVRKIRIDLLKAVVDSFNPHVIIVDYLPFGKENELVEILNTTKAKRYLILRGLIDTSDHDIFFGKVSENIAISYDEIFIAADKRIVDVAREYFFDNSLLAKIKYVGYVTSEDTDRFQVRQSNGRIAERPWIVCSGGGGMKAELYLQKCIQLAFEMPMADFDVVFGPLSNKRLMQGIVIPENCRVHSQCQHLPGMHSSCDIVITTGGYNSVMEAVTGGARIIVFPCKDDGDDEPHENAIRMSRFYPIRLVQDKEDIKKNLCQAIQEVRELPRPVFPLETNGLANIKKYILND